MSHEFLKGFAYKLVEFHLSFNDESSLLEERRETEYYFDVTGDLPAPPGFHTREYIRLKFKRLDKEENLELLIKDLPKPIMVRMEVSGDCEVSVYAKVSDGEKRLFYGAVQAIKTLEKDHLKALPEYF